jgi:hypothetical protein
MPTGTRQEQAAKLFEEVYTHSPDHPGALHYLIHVNDDPAHAEQGLEAARTGGTSSRRQNHGPTTLSTVFGALEERGHGST